MTENRVTRESLVRFGALPVLFIIFLYLAFRNAGLYPSIFSDETNYSIFSRLTPFEIVPIPSYLYFSIFRLSNACGDGFLECTRYINALLFVASAPFIYLVARRIMSANLAAWVAALSLLCPINVYTSYFMPEATYFFAFWVFSWSALRFAELPSHARAIGSGAILGLLMMIKAHALFLFPAYFLFIAYSAYRARGQSTLGQALRSALIHMALVLAAAATVRCGLGYLYAGRDGLNLFGSWYGKQASNLANSRARWIGLLPMALDNLRGHLMGLVLLFGVPLAGLAAFAASRPVRSSADRDTAPILAYALLMLSVLLGMTVMFTASVSGVGAETNARLHMRYYDFVLPFLLMFAASQLKTERGALAPAARLAIAVPLAAVMVYANFFLKHQFQPQIVDSPALFAFASERLVFRGLSVVGLVALAAWACNIRLGAKLFLFLFMPLFTIGAGRSMNRSMHNAATPDVYINAGRFAHQYLQQWERDQLTIVAADDGSLFKSMFYVDNRNAKMLVAAEGTEIPRAASPAQQKGWLLIVGNYPIPQGATVHTAGRGFALVKLNGRQKSDNPVVDFSDAIPNQYLARAVGLSGPEQFGRWSDQKTVELYFASTLPRRVQLRLEARAFGPNVGKEIVVKVGSHRQSMRLADDTQVRTLSFDNDGGEKSISIDIPRPASPMELGKGDDLRPLGIAFSSMEIGSAAGSGK
jgi:phosphoglycerol transferase